MNLNHMISSFWNISYWWLRICKNLTQLIKQEIQQELKHHTAKQFGTLPQGLLVKTPCLHFRGLGFNPWVEKICWRRVWQPTPVFFPGEPHGRRSLAGYSPWGHKIPDTTEATEHTHAGTLGSIGVKWGPEGAASWTRVNCLLNLLN